MRVLYTAFVVFCSFCLAWAEESSDHVVVEDSRLPPSDGQDTSLLLDRIRVDSDPRILQGWGDLLDRSLGARVQRSGSPGRRETLQLRGAGAHQTAVYLDGVRLSGERGGSFDLSSIVTPCIDSIDVLRGSAGAAYGSGAQGGVMRLNPLGAAQPLRLELSGGAFGYVHSSGCGGIGGRDQYLNLAIQHDQAEGTFDYTDVNGRARVRENNEHLRQAMLVNGATKNERIGRLAIVMSGHRSDRGEPGSSQFPTVDASSEEYRMASGLSWQPNSKPGARFPTAFGVQWTQRVYEFIDPDPSFSTDSERFKLEDWQGTADAKVTWSRFAWIVPSMMVQGGIHSAKTISTNGGDREEKRYTGAVVNQLDIYPASSWTFNLLNRLDVRNGRPLEWIPKTGLLWQSGPAWVWGTSIGSHFRDPSFDELFFKGSGISGNPDLRPESGWSADTHLSYRPSSQPWSLHIAAYHQQFDRIILFIPLDAYRIQASDALSARIYGLETRLGIRWSSISLESNYHYQVPRDGQNNPLPFRPPHRLNTRLEWMGGNTQIYGGMITQSSVYSDTYGRRTLPAYTLFDLGVLISLPGNFEMGVDLRNLMNRTQVFDSIHRPLPGRSVYGVLRWQDTTR